MTNITVDCPVTTCHNNGEPSDFYIIVKKGWPQFAPPNTMRLSLASTLLLTNNKTDLSPPVLILKVLTLPQQAVSTCLRSHEVLLRSLWHHNLHNILLCVCVCDAPFPEVGETFIAVLRGLNKQQHSNVCGLTVIVYRAFKSEFVVLFPLTSCGH